MGDSEESEEATYADLGGIRTLIPGSLKPVLAHISHHHSQDLETLSSSIMSGLGGNLPGTRLGDGLATVVALLQLAEDHIRNGNLVQGNADEARRDLYSLAYGLLRGLVSESQRA